MGNWRPSSSAGIRTWTLRVRKYLRRHNPQHLPALLSPLDRSLSAICYGRSYLTSGVVGLQCGSETLVVRRNPMAKTVVRARIDETIKDEAAAVLAAMGLTVSDAFRLLLVRIAREKALPFEPLIPNAETIEAMKAARRGELVTIGSVDQLFADLHADD